MHAFQAFHDQDTYSHLRDTYEDVADDPWSIDAEMVEGFRLGFGDAYAGYPDEVYESVLAELAESMSIAEWGFFKKALKTATKTATSALKSPIVRSLAGKAAPILGGTVGTFLGGPVGTALGAKLGHAAAGALGPRRRPARRVVRQSRRLPRGAVRGGSVAAKQALMLTQQPQVLQSLLGLAIGQPGKHSIGGIPISQVMGLLSKVFNDAASDADELDYLKQMDGEAVESVPYEAIEYADVIEGAING